MASTALMELVANPMTYAMVLTAVATAGYAAYRANATLAATHARNPAAAAQAVPDPALDGAARTLEGPLAAMLPLVASCAILFMFFFLRYVGAMLTALSAVTGLFSLFFLFWPSGLPVLHHLRKMGVPARPGGHIHLAIVTPPVLLLLAFWLFTGHWLVNNLLGIALCVLFASLCRVPSVKVAAILFAGLFMYDIFFVFFSERFFGTNVMVEVATSTPVNPASAVASFLHLPFHPVETLAMPAKLVFPAGHDHATILGLGDIILPEILLVYLLEFDLRNRVSGLFSGYFGRALLAYAVGLFASFAFSYTFQAAQPALLYIVPAMLIPSLLVARSKGQLALLWNGFPRTEPGVFADETGEDRADPDADARKDQENIALIS